MTRWLMAGALLLLLAACAPYQHTWPGDGAPRYYGYETVPDMGPTWRAEIIDEPTIPADPAEITVVKSASPMTFSAVGDEITYTITVRNTGDVPVSGVTLEDQLLAWVGDDARGIGTLAPGAEQVFSGTYEITQADVDAESVFNVALASGQDPDDVAIDGSGSVTVVHEEVAAPSLSVSKSATPMTFSAVGDEIAYTITVTNNGDVTVTDITVTDTLLGLDESIVSLDPGESQVFSDQTSSLLHATPYTLTYTITQVDLDRGFVTNTATASGQDPDGDPVNGEDSVTVTGPAQ